MNMLTAKFTVAAVALSLGAASVAVADTLNARAQAFADQFKQMQTLTSTSPYTFKAAPALRSTSQDAIANPSFSQRFADLQANASNSWQWQRTASRSTAIPADPVSGESFAQRFAEMQAASSNSGEWAFHPGSNALADEAKSTLVAARR